MACSVVSDLVVGFSSLFRVEMLGGTDHFLMLKESVGWTFWPMSLSQVYSY